MRLRFLTLICSLVESDQLWFQLQRRRRTKLRGIAQCPWSPMAGELVSFRYIVDGRTCLDRYVLNVGDEQSFFSIAEELCKTSAEEKRPPQFRFAIPRKSGEEENQAEWSFRCFVGKDRGGATVEVGDNTTVWAICDFGVEDRGTSPAPNRWERVRCADVLASTWWFFSWTIAAEERSEHRRRSASWWLAAVQRAGGCVMERLSIALRSCLESGSAVFTRQSTELSTIQSLMQLYGCTVWWLSFVWTLFTLSLSVKRGYIGPSMVPGSWEWGWGHFCFFEHFCFFFFARSLWFFKKVRRETKKQQGSP